MTREAGRDAAPAGSCRLKKVWIRWMRMMRRGVCNGADGAQGVNGESCNCNVEAVWARLKVACDNVS